MSVTVEISGSGKDVQISVCIGNNKGEEEYRRSRKTYPIVRQDSVLQVKNAAGTDAKAESPPVSMAQMTVSGTRAITQILTDPPDC